MNNYEVTATNMETFQSILSNMNTEEFEAAHKIMSNRVTEIALEKISEIERKQEIAEVKMEQMQDDIGNIKIRQKKTDDKLNNLRQPENRKYRRAITKRVKKIAYKYLGEYSSEKSVLFHWHFYKALYGAIKYKFGLASWEDLSVENADDPGSDFRIACDLLDNWTPSRKEVLRWIDGLIKQRDNAVLRQDRCKALTSYLSTHNINATNEPLLP